MKNRVDIAEQRVPPENWNLEESRTPSGCDDELLAIYESTPFMILLLDQERRICKANRVARGFSGPDSRDVTGLRSGEALRCIHSIDDPRGCGFGHHCDNCTMRRIIAETMATGKSHHHVEVHFPFNAGETIKNLAFLISTTRLVVRNEPHILVIIQDITAIKETEADHLRLLTAIDQAAEAIVLADGRRRILYVNQAFERITGCSRTQTLGQDWAQWHGTPHEPSIHDIIFEQLKTGTAWQGRITNSRPDGTTYEAEMTVSPIRDAAGNATDFVSVIRDVTRESQLESQLLHAQKMEAIGTLAGGIAHDFNNILQALLGYATLVETSVAANS